jgi:TPP-dependent pyruvate/acetoin dehydrogenase alpha subunit
VFPQPKDDGEQRYKMRHLNSQAQNKQPIHRLNSFLITSTISANSALEMCGHVNASSTLTAAACHRTR